MLSHYFNELERVLILGGGRKCYNFFSLTNCADIHSTIWIFSWKFSSGDGKDVGFVAPCGGCRQIIYEFGHSTNCTVLMVENSGKECRKMAIKDLLPGAFGPDALLNN